jgi:hypothetical protein
MGKSGNPQIQTAQAGLAAGIPSIPSTMMSAPAPTGRPANTGLPPGFDIRHIQSGVGNMDMTRASSAAPAPAPAPAAAPAAAPAEPNVFSQAQQYQRQAGGIYGRLGEFEARDVEAPEAYTPERIAAGQLADVDYGQYMNPYTQQVIERGQSDIERQRQLAAQQMGAQAQAAKAFGGSRQAVQAANLAGEYGRMGMDFAAQQRQQAFQQAQQAAAQDIQRQMQADLANQAAFQQQSQFGAGQQMQAALANQAADISGAQVQMGAAGGLGGLGQQLFGQGMGVQQQIGQQGAFQRGLQQQMIDRAMAQYGGATGAPLAGLGALTQVLSGIPYGQTQTTSQPFNPATLMYLL